MSHVPMGDIQSLWNWTPDHNWSALIKTLQDHISTTEGISNNLIVMMLHHAKKLEQENKKYPDNPRELYDMMNKYVETQR